MLVYRRADNLELVGYLDSNLIGCLDDLKSTSRFIFMLSGGVISWRSVKWTLIASSIIQAKSIAYYGTATQAVWSRNLIAGFLIVHSIIRLLTIYCHNRTVVFFTKNNKSFSGSKYFELKYLTVRDFVKKEDITIKHIDTKSMLADPLIKRLRLICFTRYVKNMNILSSFDILAL